MKALVLIPFILAGCSQPELQVEGSASQNISIVSRGSYKSILGAEDVLRKVSEATVKISFFQTGKQQSVQDMIAFSVGGTEKKTSSSRLSLRMDREGYLTGIARATDTENAQTVRSNERIPAGKKHTAVLVVDYAKNEMFLYLDGVQLETIGKPVFRAKQTDDTPSINSSIGSEDDGSDFFFEGELSDPGVWRRKLSLDEIKKL